MLVVKYVNLDKIIDYKIPYSVLFMNIVITEHNIPCFKYDIIIAK